jgi:lipopolysaccharide transport system ATP-binding protein
MKSINDFRIGFYLKTAIGENLMLSLLADWDESHINLGTGTFTVTGTLPRKLLSQGNYSIDLHASRFGIKDYGLTGKIQKQIHINNPSNFRLSYLGENTSFGPLLVDPKWKLKKG